MKSIVLTYNYKKKLAFSLLFCALFIALSSYSFAASWQLAKGANERERLVINLDEPMPNIEVKRNDGLSLDISVPLPSISLTQQGTVPANSFVKSVELINGNYKIHMNKAGFGYIMASPANGSKIEIELYPDPLMERFYPADGSKPTISTNTQASAPTTQTPAPTTQTPAPATPAPATPAPATTQTAPTPAITTPAPTFTPAQSAVSPAVTPSTPKTTEETAEERPVADIPDSQDPDGTNAQAIAPPSISISPLEAMLNPPADLERNPHAAALLQNTQEQVAPITTPAPTPAPVAEVVPAPIASPAPVAEVVPSTPITEVIAPAPIAPTTPVAEVIAPAAPVAEVIAPNLPETIAPIINQELAQEEIIEEPKVEEPRPEAMAAAAQPVAPSPTPNPAPIQNADPSKIFYGNSILAPLKDIPHDSPDVYVQPTSAVQENDNQLETSFLFEEAPPPLAYTSNRSLQIYAILQNSVSKNAIEENSSVFTGTLLAFNSNEFTMLANDTSNADINAPAPALGDVAAPNLSALEENNPFSAEPPAPEPAPEPAPQSYDETIPTMPMTIEEAMEQGRPIIFQDTEGNIIDAPPNPNDLLPMLEQAMKSNDYENALLTMEILLTIRLHNDDNEHIKLKEKLLRDYAVALYGLHRQELDIEGQRVLDAAITAMNYNLEAKHVPELVNIIVRTHFAMGNIDDAEGYILMLQEMYPDAGSLVAELLLMLANIQLNNQEYAKAVITTQRILDYYGSSMYVQEAAIVQTKAFYKQGHYDRALPMITFINMRWPDSYIRFPEYLSIVADVQIAQQLYKEASDTLWTEYNLDPTGPNAANLLNRLAILYYSQADFEGASKVQLELINSFPDHPEVPSALIRIAENSFQAPNPPLDTLLALFAVPTSRLPSITYQQIMDNYPNTIQAIEAHTRLAAWNYFNQEYDTAMLHAVDIMEKYPDRPYYNVALDVLLRSFSARLENALLEDNVARALDLWERYPGVQNYYLPLEDDLRVALARGYLNRGDSVNGLNHLQIFIDPIQDAKYGIYAYNLFLNQYLNNGQWQEILDLDEKIGDWDMPIDIRNQHNYTVALACENLGMSTRAIPIWQDIVRAQNIPLYQSAYANYFLARDAETKQDLRGTYQYNLDALAMFEQLAEERSEFSDPPRIRESIAALMDVTEVAGRFAEALDWLNKYTPFIAEDSPDYAGLQLREARLYKKMGDTNKWRVVLRDIIQREPDSVFGTMAASELKADQLSRDIERFVN